MNNEPLKTESENPTPPQIFRDLLSQTWNPELLISTFAIFVLIKVPDWIWDLKYLLRYDYNFKMIGGDIVVMFINSAVYTLIITFVIHLILRSYWVGIIGLQYVYKEGVRLDKLKYRPRFAKYLGTRISNLDLHEHKIDNISSALFAFGFLCFFCLFSIFMYLLFPVCVGLLFSVNIGPSNIMSIVGFFSLVIYLLSGLLYLFDFMTFGLIKKNKVLAPVYFPVYWFFSLITLSFIYRPLYYTFISNISPKKLIPVMLIFLSVGLFLVYGSMKSNYNHESFIWSDPQRSVMDFASYDNLRPVDERLPALVIQSDMVQGNCLRLFINEWYLMVCSEYDNEIFSRLSKKSVDSVVILTINDSVYSGLKYRFFEYPGRKGRGVVAYINTNGLREGENTISIRPRNRQYAVRPEKLFFNFQKQGTTLD